LTFYSNVAQIIVIEIIKVKSTTLAIRGGFIKIQDVKILNLMGKIESENMKGEKN
jgi:hypothetical protein